MGDAGKGESGAIHPGLGIDQVNQALIRSLPATTLCADCGKYGLPVGAVRIRVGAYAEGLYRRIYLPKMSPTREALSIIQRVAIELPS